MSGLAIAFPAEVAAAVAQAVISGMLGAARPLLLLAVGVTLLLICKPYATPLMVKMGKRLVQIGHRVESGVKHLRQRLAQ